MNEVAAEPIAEKLAELNLALSPEIHYRLGTVFSRTDSMSLEQAIGQKYPLVKACEPVLLKALFEREQVLFVCLGELRFQKTIVVLTNLRMLLFSTDRKQVPWQPYWAIYYSQISELQPVFMEQYKILLKDGSKLKFNYFPWQDRQNFQPIYSEAAQRVEEEGLDPPVSQSRENLCSNCFATVPKETYECEACGATFWMPFDLAIRSFIWLPIGIFAMRRTRVAIREVLIYLFLLFFVVFWQAKGNTTFAIFTFVLTNASFGDWIYRQAKRGLLLKEIPLEKQAVN